MEKNEQKTDAVLVAEREVMRVLSQGEGITERGLYSRLSFLSSRDVCQAILNLQRDGSVKFVWTEPIINYHTGKPINGRCRR